MKDKTILTKKVKYETCKNTSSQRMVILPWRECWTPAKDIDISGAIQQGLGKNCDHIQYLYRFKNGYGVSLAANEYTRSYRLNFGHMEAALIYFPNKKSNHFDLVFSNPACDDEAGYWYVRGDDMEEVKLEPNTTQEFHRLWHDGMMYAVRSMFEDKFQRGLREVKSL